MPIALTRPVSPKLEECELTHVGRVPIDIAKCRQQHANYERCLEKLGCTIRQLPETPHLADGVFVEDTAIVFPEVGIITRPGAVSRQEETRTMASVLSEYRELRYIKAPGTLDGGDVLTLGKTVYAGLSSRSNREGIRQLEEHLRPFGYQVVCVPVTSCLHFKTALAVLGNDKLLVNPEWVDTKIFDGYSCISVDPAEPFGANVMCFGERALCLAAFPKTGELLDQQGFSVMSIDYSELTKAEAGLTCCSVIIE